MPINNPSVSQAELEELQSNIIQDIADKHGVTLNQLASIVAEANENQALIEALQATNGNIDTTATTINNNTNLVRDAILGAGNRTNTAIYDLVQTLSGWATDTDLVNARNNINANTDSQISAVRGADNRNLSGIYDLIAALSGWATPANVNSARDVITENSEWHRNLIRGASNRDLTQVYNRIPVSGWSTAANLSNTQNAIEKKVVESSGAFNPKTTNLIGGINQELIQFTNLNSTNWVALVAIESASASGILRHLRGSTALQLHVHTTNEIGGATLDFYRDFDSANLRSWILPDGSQITPPTRYNGRLFIYYRRRGSVSINNTVDIGYVKESD